MDLASLVQTYGYLAVFLGTVIEGETILAIAGFFSSQGYLSLWGIALAGMAGSVVGDQIAFAIGRRQGVKLLTKYPRWQKRIERASRLLTRHQVFAIMGFRFIYGIRIITPIILGTGPISTKKFVFLNISSAVIWSILVSVSGYLFVSIVLVAVHDIRKYELVGIALIVAVGITIWVARGLIVWWDARYYAEEQ